MSRFTKVSAAEQVNNAALTGSSDGHFLEANGTVRMDPTYTVVVASGSQQVATAGYTALRFRQIVGTANSLSASLAYSGSMNYLTGGASASVRASLEALDGVIFRSTTDSGLLNAFTASLASTASNASGSALVGYYGHTSATGSVAVPGSTLYAAINAIIDQVGVNKSNIAGAEAIPGHTGSYGLFSTTSSSDVDGAVVQLVEGIDATRYTHNQYTASLVATTATNGTDRIGYQGHSNGVTSVPAGTLTAALETIINALGLATGSTSLLRRSDNASFSTLYTGSTTTSSIQFNLGSDYYTVGTTHVYINGLLQKYPEDWTTGSSDSQITIIGGLVSGSKRQDWVSVNYIKKTTT
jgi:hypothetical protein